jgi:hypothetical protein
MRRKKATLYDAHEKRILQQASAFAEFFTRRGVIADYAIEDEAARKARQSATKKAYHNTEVLLDQYRTIVWVLECVPGELAAELKLPTQDLDELISRIDFEMAMENKRLESRLNTIIKTRILLERVQDALMVLRKKPNDGEILYRLIYDAFLDPVERNAQELMDRAQLAPRTYYRMRADAIAIMSIRLWSAPSSEIDDWLEIIAMMEGI